MWAFHPEINYIGSFGSVVAPIVESRPENCWGLFKYTHENLDNIITKEIAAAELFIFAF
jgi:hypothetical protein